MQHNELKAIRELYVTLAVTRAITEIDEIFNRTEAEREGVRELEAELKKQARSVYARERELLANEDEFELVWLTIRDDLMREIKALQAMYT